MFLMSTVYMAPRVGSKRQIFLLNENMNQLSFPEQPRSAEPADQPPVQSVESGVLSHSPAVMGELLS